MFVSHFRRIDVAAAVPARLIGRVKFRRLGEVWRSYQARGTEKRCPAPRRKGKIEKCHREL